MFTKKPGFPQKLQSLTTAVFYFVRSIFSSRRKSSVSLQQSPVYPRISRVAYICLCAYIYIHMYMACLFLHRAYICSYIWHMCIFIFIHVGHIYMNKNVYFFNEGPRSIAVFIGQILFKNRSACALQFWRRNRALWQINRSLLQRYRALLRRHGALSWRNRTLSAATTQISIKNSSAQALHFVLSRSFAWI